MKKKLTAVVVLILFVFAAVLSGCSKNNNDKITVATIDGQNIARTEYLEYWQRVLDGNGITQEDLESEQYKQELEDLKKELLEDIVRTKVIETELEALGYYQLTQEEDQTVKSQVQALLDAALSSKSAEMTAELGEDYTDAQYARAVAKYTKLALEEYGYTEEYIKDFYLYNLVETKAKADLINITVTSEDIQELFNQRIEEDKEMFSDLQAYEYYTGQQGYVPYYIPEGLRKVRHVLIAFDDETIAQIQNLRGAGDDQKADELRAASLEAIQEKAQSVLDEIKSESISFDEAIGQYNDDEGMIMSPEGYEMSLDSMRYVQEFTDAGMALKNLGDISDLVPSDFGYHIMQYYLDVESGPISLDDELKSSLDTELLEIKKEEGWNALVDEWIQKHEIVYFYENLYNEESQETSEPVEAQ